VLQYDPALLGETSMRSKTVKKEEKEQKENAEAKEREGENKK
jgi:hypothetical protein